MVTQQQFEFPLNCLQTDNPQTEPPKLVVLDIDLVKVPFEEQSRLSSSESSKS